MIERLARLWSGPLRHISSRARPVLVIVVLCALPSCSTVPRGQASVDRIDVRGESALSERELEKLLVTKQSSKFAGVIRGVFFDHSLYNHHVLQMDIQRVERIYRAHGYYHARVLSTRVHFRNEEHVRVVIEVEEGEPTLVEHVHIDGLPEVSRGKDKRLHAAVKRHTSPGNPFQERAFEEAAENLLFTLRDLGFARAKVERKAHVDLVRHQAHLTFTVSPGRSCTIGSIEIDGLADEIPERKIRQILQIEEGNRYSQSDLRDAQSALLALGVFSSVRIVPKLEDDPDSTSIPIVVETKPTSLRMFEIGGGSQLDVVRAALHGRLGWQSQNFLGGLRHFRAELRPGVVFYPTRLQALIPPTDLLPFVSAETTLKQRSLFGGRTDGVVGARVDVYPLLVSPHIDPDSPVLGYAEEEGHVALERTWRGHLFTSPKYALTFAQPFAYQGQLDPALHPLTISSLEFFGRYDTRDDLLFPTRGLAVSASVEYAGGPLGGQVTDVGFGPELRTYLPIAKGWTVALRAATDLLFPQNWGQHVDESGAPASNSSRAEWVRDTQISLFRSLFAGGPNSNRGYAQRGIGPHGVIPFFVPALQGPETAANCENDPQGNPATCLLPLGGRTKWEATIELRYPIFDDLYGAVFCDAADVAPSALQYRFDRPHLSCGLGPRYATPIGPFRLDVGYRIPGLQTLGSDEGEGVPPTLFGVPVAVAFSVGEAF